MVIQQNFRVLKSHRMKWNSAICFTALLDKITTKAGDGNSGKPHATEDEELYYCRYSVTAETLSWKGLIMYSYWLWLVLLCFQQSMILTFTERLGQVRNICKDRGQAYTGNALSLAECGIFWQGGVPSATTFLNISLVEETVPVKTLNFYPPFFTCETVDVIC